MEGTDRMEAGETSPSTVGCAPASSIPVVSTTVTSKDQNDFATAIPVASPASSNQEGRRHAATRAAPKVQREWQNQYLRIIVVGESGTGKSTFINNLLHSYKGEPVLSSNRSINAPTPASVFHRQPEQLCTSFAIENEPERIRIHYSMQDTPGYGDSFDIRRRLDDIVQFIKNQQAAYFELQRDVMTDQGDPRVDVCLYFIPPHRLKQVDIEFMKVLAKAIPLIPIIAKADSMTENELECFRDLILQRASDERISFFEFSNEALLNVLGEVAVEVFDDGSVPSVVATRCDARCLCCFPSVFFRVADPSSFPMRAQIPPVCGRVERAMRFGVRRVLAGEALPMGHVRGLQSHALRLFSFDAAASRRVLPRGEAQHPRNVHALQGREAGRGTAVETMYKFCHVVPACDLRASCRLVDLRGRCLSHARRAVPLAKHTPRLEKGGPTSRAPRTCRRAVS